jgi:hypothetical protein
MKDKLGNFIEDNCIVEITFISGRKQYERVKKINNIFIVEKNSLLSNFNTESLRKILLKEEIEQIEKKFKI